MTYPLLRLVIQIYLRCDPISPTCDNYVFNFKVTKLKILNILNQF